MEGLHRAAQGMPYAGALLKCRGFIPAPIGTLIRKIQCKLKRLSGLRPEFTQLRSGCQQGGQKEQRGSSDFSGVPSS